MRVLSARAALFGTAAAAAFIPAPAFAKATKATVALSAAAQTAAQATAEANKPAAGAQPTAALSNRGQDTATGEIVVTARRTEERLQRVPASISAFNARALDRIQATDTTGLQGAVPNLNIVQGRGSSNATNIYIRGIGQPDALQTFDPAVGVYIDDVYLSRIRGNQLDLLDVDRIEVLRGPQGTLYGKNTIGGAIKYVTRKPGNNLRVDTSLAIGNHGQVELKGDVSGPIAKNISAGIAVIHAEHAGYVKDRVLNQKYNNKNSTGVRGALAITPTSSVRIDLDADYSHDHNALNVGQPVNNLNSLFGVPLPVDRPVGSAPYDWTARVSPGLPNSSQTTHYGFSGTVAIDVMSGLTLKSITAYRNLRTADYIDIDASQYQLGDVFVGVHQKQFSQEFQALYTGDRLSGVAGLYYLHELVPSHQEAYGNDAVLTPFFPGATFLRTVDDDLSTKSYAAYANASFTVVPTVRISAGIRQTRETKDYTRTTSTFSNYAAFRGTFPFAPPRGTWTDTSPMASVDWQVTPATMVYARVAKGFKSGGFNGRANSVAESTKYDPETVWSYEAGFKTTIANQLRLNGAVFDNEYKDFQARVSGLDTDPITGLPAAKLSVLNAGKLRIKGAELEGYWTPTREVLIDTQIGYLDSKYVDFADVRFTSFGGSRAFQTPAFSPKWTFRVGAQYTFDIGNSGAVTIGGQTRYRSRQALAVDNTAVNSNVPIEGLFQNAYWVEDARLVWENASKKVAVGVYVNNITKKAYKTDAQEFSSVGNIRTVYYGAPRTITLRLTSHY
jgi:iron complex outermembrane receptor protein